MNVNSKQRETLESIFRDPVRCDILWSDIESLLLALGGNIKTGHGSVMRFELNDVRGTFHRPHPRKITDKGAVKSVREFLVKAGLKIDGKYD